MLQVLFATTVLQFPLRMLKIMSFMYYYARFWGTYLYPPVYICICRCSFTSAEMFLNININWHGEGRSPKDISWISYMVWGPKHDININEQPQILVENFSWCHYFPNGLAEIFFWAISHSFPCRLNDFIEIMFCNFSHRTKPRSGHP